MARCRICSQHAVREWLDFGWQTLTNRFLTARSPSEFAHPCKIGACRGMIEELIEDRLVAADKLVRPHAA